MSSRRFLTVQKYRTCPNRAVCTAAAACTEENYRLLCCLLLALFTAAAVAELFSLSFSRRLIQSFVVLSCVVYFIVAVS